MSLARRVFIVGGAHTPFIGKHHPDFIWKRHPDFGKRSNPDFEQHLRSAVEGAIEDSGVDPERVDRLYIGNFTGELFVNQGHMGAALAGSHPAFAYKPAARLEGACASGGLAVLSGIDAIAFHVRTNPGSRPGPIMKVASGGELSRFLLAIKVALADRGSAPTLVFDEIDTGVGGAVADAIGKRLKRLASGVQVLSVTHAPQVAARAATHHRIADHRRPVLKPEH